MMAYELAEECRGGGISFDNEDAIHGGLRGGGDGGGACRAPNAKESPSRLLDDPQDSLRPYGNLRRMASSSWNYEPNGKPAMLQAKFHYPYFEMTVVSDSGRDIGQPISGMVSVGFARKGGDAKMLVGLQHDSVGVHNDDLKAHFGGKSRPLLKSWDSGDVVGVGIYNRRVYFTSNGIHMGVAFTLGDEYDVESYLPTVSVSSGKMDVIFNLGPDFRHEYELKGIEKSNQIFQRFDKNSDGRLRHSEVKDIILSTLVPGPTIVISHDPLPYPSYTNFCRLTGCESPEKGLSASNLWTLYEEGYGTIDKDWEVLTQVLTRPELTKQAMPPTILNTEKTGYTSVMSIDMSGFKSSDRNKHGELGDRTTGTQFDILHNIKAGLRNLIGGQQTNKNMHNNKPCSLDLEYLDDLDEDFIQKQAEMQLKEVYSSYSVAIDGGWSEWSECTKSCGWDGMQKRTCTEPSPSGGGRPCKGPNSRACNRRRCLSKPVWSRWTPCSKTCGYGVQYRTCLSDTLDGCEGDSRKTCKNPVPCRNPRDWDNGVMMPAPIPVRDTPPAPPQQKMFLPHSESSSRRSSSGTSGSDNKVARIRINSKPSGAKLGIISDGVSRS